MVKNMRRVWIVIALLGLALGNSMSQTIYLPKAVSMESVGAGSNPIAQTIVEAMRAATSAELAILGAAFFDETMQFPVGQLSVDALLKAVRYPDDEVVVLKLTGEQLLEALERAVELYPQKNNAFLQLTGAEIRFDPKAAPGKRIQSVFISGAKLDPKRTYRVATIAPIARGALGYFRIWSKEQISTSTGRSLAEVVRDYLQRQRSLISEPSWVAQ